MSQFDILEMLPYLENYIPEDLVTMTIEKLVMLWLFIEDR